MDRRDLIVPLRNARGSAMMIAIMAAVLMGIILFSFGSQIGYSRTAVLTLKKEAIFNDLVGQLQSVTNSPTLCTTALGGSTPVTGAVVSFVNPAALVNLADNAAFQNGQISITHISWGIVDHPSAMEAVGYLKVQASLAGTGTSTTVGSTTRFHPMFGEDPHAGIRVPMKLNAAGAVVSCGSGMTVQYFSFPITITNIYNSIPFWGTATLPFPFPNTNYSVVCTISNPWSVTNHGGGPSFGYINVYNLQTNGFNYRYFQEYGDNIPLGYIVTAHCVAGLK